jgi:hypothetical protein
LEIQYMAQSDCHHAVNQKRCHHVVIQKKRRPVGLITES